MPFYCFECPGCRKKEELIRSIGDRNTVILCNVCSFVMVRDFSAEHGAKTFAEAGSFWSDTMGCAPEQVADERKRHPDWTFSDDGQVLVEGLKDQRKKCRDLEMVNFDDNIG